MVRPPDSSISVPDDNTESQIGQIVNENREPRNVVQ